jgi:hypothetical protein
MVSGPLFEALVGQFVAELDDQLDGAGRKRSW